MGNGVRGVRTTCHQALEKQPPCQSRVSRNNSDFVRIFRNLARSRGVEMTDHALAEWIYAVRSTHRMHQLESSQFAFKMPRLARGMH